MKHFIRLVCFSFSICLPLLACSNKQRTNHFILNDSTRRQVMMDLKKKEKALAKQKALFDILYIKDSVSKEEREVLQFLYAYMNSSDMANYSGRFFLENVRATLRSQSMYKWTEKVPQELFLHFVLPIRVNNENLDLSRDAFSRELYPRIKHLSMKEAILEVNHWCHEKVTYAPSGPRTRSPFSSVLNAIGRCGEESTFTVAALRAVGIPARQVYTPRWAHTDDNHAWVEAWADGKWYFIGACEPAPVLNDAWFNSAVSRAMLCYTKAFGPYKTSEDIIKETPNYTEINVVSGYTPTDNLVVEVKNPDGSPAKGAELRFTIYNYAEFYPVVTRFLDATGKTSLRIGRGDMFVWASKDSLVAYGLSRVGEERERKLSLVLAPINQLKYEDDFRIHAPLPSTIRVEASQEAILKCERELVREDSIRQSYEATFFTIERAENFISSIGLNPSKYAHILVHARGNHLAICNFLEKYEGRERERAARFLTAFSEKDWTDTPYETLLALFKETPKGLIDHPFTLEYVASPRISTEYLEPYKNKLRTLIPGMEDKMPLEKFHTIFNWIKKNITIDSIYNTQNLYFMPNYIAEYRLCDPRSLDLFFVAMARSYNLPARIDPITSSLQYSLDMGEHWETVHWAKNESRRKAMATYQLSYEANTIDPDPAYYSRYTIAQIGQNGRMNTLSYDENSPLKWSEFLKYPQAIEAGEYYLISGTRMASGDVLCHMQRFKVAEHEEKQIPLKLNQDKSELSVIGTFNVELPYYHIAKETEQPLIQTTGRGYYVLAFLGAGQEPTNHALKDISRLKKDLEMWGRSMVFLFPTETDYKRFVPSEFPQLPMNVVLGIDKRGILAEEISKQLNIEVTKQLPCVLIADSFGRIVFKQQGYTIGLGETLRRALVSLK